MSEAHPQKSASSSNTADASKRRTVPSPEGIYDPVARSLDVIGDRWSLVLVRQLLLGPKGFSELRQRTGIAPRVLSSRLRDLSGTGCVFARPEGGYSLTELGRSLEPIVSSIAIWFTRHGFEALKLNRDHFTKTSPQSIIESLPFLLSDEVAADACVTFELRLTGNWGGVWTVTIENGQCEVSQGFAEHADVRYTADCEGWCAMALGLVDARDLVKRGLLMKDGGPAAMDHYFTQIDRSAERIAKASSVLLPENEEDAADS